MVAQLFSEYFRGVLLARYEEGEAVEETDRQTNRQTDRETGETTIQTWQTECLLVFAYFALMTLFLSVACGTKRK